MSDIDHIILYLFLFSASLVWSKSNSLHRKQFSIIFASLFIFVVGSRIWGPDYAWYNYKVDHPNDLSVKEDELGFQWLNTLIRFVGLNGDGAFYIYALILMIGTVSVINSFKSNWRYMCLFIIPAILLETSTHIRQGIAFSFALISYYFLRKDKKAWAIVFAIVAFNIHKIIIVLFIVAFVAFLISKKKIPVCVIISAYTIATFLPQILNLDNIMQYLNLIQIGGKYSGYIDNSERWFSESASNLEWQQGTFALALSYLYDVAMFLIVDLSLKKDENKEVRTLFYTFVIGAVFIRFFFLNELLRRTFTLPYMVYFISVGYALSFLSVKLRNILSRTEVKVFITSVVIIILYYVLYWGRFIFMNKDCKFLWS